MKGTVYTGIIFLPKHPNADMHGLLRCAVRTNGGMSELTRILRIYDIPFSPVLFNWGIWCESKSMAEAAATERNYGRAMVCPTWCQYLESSRYELIPETFKHATGVVVSVEHAQAILEKVGLTLAIAAHLFTPAEDGIGKKCKVCHQAKDENPRHVKAELASAPDGVKIETEKS
jgi:hypothetical protein